MGLIHSRHKKVDSISSEDHVLLHNGSLTDILKLREISNENKCTIQISQKDHKIKLSSNIEKFFGYNNKNITMINIKNNIPTALSCYIDKNINNPEVLLQLNYIRNLPIKTINHKIVWVENIYCRCTNKGYIISFNISEAPLISPNVPREFKYSLSYEPIFNIRNYENCYIIMMDLYNSTNITKNKLPQEVALFYHLLIKKMNYVINHKYYPCVIHIESVGDSFMLWSNPVYSFQCQDKIFLILDFVRDFYNNIQDTLCEYDTYMRCGISFGNCCGGIWDGKTFRVSGNIVNLAARLEAKCERNHIYLSLDCINPEQLQTFKNIETKNIYLKSYGYTDVYCYKI